MVSYRHRVIGSVLSINECARVTFSFRRQDERFDMRLLPQPKGGHRSQGTVGAAPLMDKG